MIASLQQFLCFNPLCYQNLWNNLWVFRDAAQFYLCLGKFKIVENQSKLTSIWKLERLSDLHLRLYLIWCNKNMWCSLLMKSNSWTNHCYEPVHFSKSKTYCDQCHPIPKTNDSFELVLKRCNVSFTALAKKWFISYDWNITK